MTTTDTLQIGEIAASINTHGQLLLGLIEQLEDVPTVYRHQYKHRAKAFIAENEKLLEQIHGPLNERDNADVMQCYEDQIQALSFIDSLTVAERRRFVELREDIKKLVAEK